MLRVSVLIADFRGTSTDDLEIKEAHELARPHIKVALVILSDDDPSNDGQGYINLANAFIAVSDDVNALAVYQSLRPMKKGVAVLASDMKGSSVQGTLGVGKAEEEAETQDTITGAEAKADKGEHGVETEEEDEEADEDYDDDDCWTCDGLCVRAFNDFDGAVICRMGCTLFCRSCYDLFLEDKIPFRICSRAHEHLEVPVLETRFKEGELVVAEKVVTLEEWKKSIQKSWGL